MLDQILSLIKKIIPKKVFRFFQPAYHWTLAKFSALVFGFPSSKMIVVGVTGTSGKSSTCYFATQLLESAGFKVGLITTTLFKIDKKEWLNDKKMTMLGRFQMQKMLWQMRRAGCNVVIIETSSQGVEQFRHIGINYDILVFTNLYPEHIEAHGSFENYKKAKQKLFKYLGQLKNKKLSTLKSLKKKIIVNGDDKHAKDFLAFPVDLRFVFGTKHNLEHNPKFPVAGSLIAREIAKIDHGYNVKIGNVNLEIPLLGKYNVSNFLAAASVALCLGVGVEKIIKAVKNLKPLPGRLEFIKNRRGLKIVVDYAFEPKAMEKLYETIKDVPHGKIIHVLGSAGGGRDIARRPILGKMAAENADTIIITNEDPYDEDPKKIIEEVAAGAEEIRNQKSEIGVIKILDRRKAIKEALKLAKKGDLILITGKGAEQAICVKNGKKIKWDDRVVVMEELKK